MQCIRKELPVAGPVDNKKKRGKKMHIRKKDLFMGLIGLSMMLGSTFSPAQLSELVDELRTMR